MVQNDLSEKNIFLGFQCLLSPWNMPRNMENQERGSNLVNKKIKLK